MRTKADILESTERNANKATGADDILLIHSLHSLEVMIDIRDELHNLNKSVGSNILDLARES